MPRDVAGHHQRHEGQRRGRHRHQDRPEALPRPAHDQPGAKGFALILLQVVIVTHQHDAVARHNAQHGEESHERAEREDAARRERRQYAAH